MNRIAAADNLSIEMFDGSWRLIANGDQQPKVLIEVQSGKPLRYVTGFAASRRLPDTGALPAEQIQRVVLGWSGSDEAWHLGLVLKPELAEVRGSRWCEIASWPDPERTTYSDPARQAGEALAQVITRPFYLVPVKNTTAAELPTLPLDFGLWTLERPAQGGVQFVRDASWDRAVIRRVLWYALWVVVYIVLIVTTLSGNIAPARPEFLPYLGMFSALVLVGLIASHLYRYFTLPDRIESRSGVVRGMRGSRERWRLDRSDIRSVYISEIIKHGRDTKPYSHYFEVNLQCVNNTFWYILSCEEEQQLNDLSPDPVNEIRRENLQTPAQAAGLYMAEEIGVPAMYDLRES